MKIKQWIQLCLYIFVIEGIGGLSAFLSGNIAQKYSLLTKIPLSPPSSLFGITWPLLYLFMALALFLIHQGNKLKTHKTKATLLFSFQLFLNFLWCIFFFGSNTMWLAFLVIVILDCSVFLTLRYFYFLNKWAGFLFIPYFLWILFATYLNFGFALVN